MSELPDGWAVVPAGELGEWRGGGTPSKSNDAFWRDGTIPWVSPKDMKRQYITDAEDHITEAAIAGSATNRIPENSILMVTRSGILQHSLPVAINTVPVTVNQDLKALSPFEGILPAYVLRHLQADAQRILEAASKTGTTVESIDFDRLKAYPIRLAPLPEQKRIVAKVDGLTARTARARADLDRIPTLIARYKQRLLALALCGGLTADWRTTYGSNGWVEKGIRQLSERRATYEKSKRGSRLRSAPPLEKGPTAGLPSSWISCCLADVADLRVGYAFKSDWFSSKGVRLVRGANVAPGRLDWSDERRLSPEHVPSFSEYSLEAGDVVIAMDRPLISTGLKIAIVEAQDAGALLVQRVANPRPTEWLHPLFMYHVFCGREFISQVESHATGSDLPHISGNDILTTKVPLPPIEEQVEIVNRIKSAFNWLERIAADHAAAARLLPKLDAAILAKAFRGELVPQDPNDEPASAFLARIKGANAYSDAKTATRANRVRRLEKTKSDAPMNKTRNDSNVRGKPYLTAILRERKVPVTPNELHSLSGLPLHEFYHQLAQEYDEGWLRDIDGRVGVA
ncbi:restriction endonuclease subunit S [Rhodobacter capsulatus]|uniref:restriction endonuclease subunit S n=1 Tax=Rhodobacter capsulatus TaxID=1061 RepID=UPI004027BC0D